MNEEEKKAVDTEPDRTPPSWAVREDPEQHRHSRSSKRRRRNENLNRAYYKLQRWLHGGGKSSRRHDSDKADSRNEKRYQRNENLNQSYYKLKDWEHGVGKSFRKIFRPMDDKLQDITDDINESVNSRRGRRLERQESRRAKREARWARLAANTAGIVHAPGYLPGIERARLILMFFMCLNLLGVSTGLGGYLKTFCGFVPLAFYMLSGYLVLGEGEDRSARIGREIRRAAIAFGILAAVYFVLNLVYYGLNGVNIFSAFTRTRYWFNFLVLNVWQFDIGGAIWYVQALLYAYIIIYFLDKAGLLKYDWIIAAVLIVFTVVTGELSGIIRWEWKGYTYIPGNFLTRALPYTLLGCFVRRKSAALEKRGKGFYILGIFVGILLMLAEIILLGMTDLMGYYGHLIGMAVTAFSVCMLAVKSAEVYGFEQFFGLSRRHINSIYYLCQPVSTLLLLLPAYLTGNLSMLTIQFTWLFTFIVCFAIVWLAAVIGRKIKKENDKNNKISQYSDPDLDDL